MYEPARDTWSRWSTRSVRAPSSKNNVFAQFQVLREPTFGANFAIFDVFCANIRGYALIDPSPYRVRSRDEVMTLAQSLFSYNS